MKKKEPVIRQTENGPMQEIREQLPLGWYAAGAFSVLYACFLPLYTISDILIMLGLAVAVGALVQHFTPVHTRLVPCEAPKANTGSELADQILAEGEASLQAIRDANRALPDEKISAQLDQIESACRRIFDYIRQHPERAGQIRKFMNYYLPTLLQLLQIRTQLETGGGSGANIASSKQRIDAMLAQTVTAFDTFYDQLHADQTMNVNAEISVFETMLKQEGLLESDAITAQEAPVLKLQQTP